jgi:hypothetical protein
MTTAQILTFFIMPVGGFIIGLVGLYVTRHTREHTQPGE